jgi:hypothetical protein
MKTVFVAGILIFCAIGQSSSEPPTLLRVIRSVARPGLEANVIQPYVNAKAPVMVFGMTAITGMPETWLVEAHDSFASIEDLDKTLGAVVPGGAASVMATGPDDLLTPSRAMIAIYRPEWSYRPQEALQLVSKATYYHVSIYRSLSGADADFAEVNRERRAGLASVNLDRPDIAYEVIGGAPSGTYLVLAPLTSLRTLDDGIAARSVRGGGGGGAAAAKAGVTREHLLFHVEPRMGYVPEAQ